MWSEISIIKINYKRGFVNMKDIYEKVLIGLIEVILVAGGIAIIALYGQLSIDK